MDTKLNRERFSNDTGLEPSENNKIKKAYRSWLIKHAKTHNISIYLKPNSEEKGSMCCYYLCYCTFPMILIFGAISIMHFSPILQAIVPLLTIFLTLLIFFLIQKYENYKTYKRLNSEIKQIIFEEETGYKPTKKGRLTFKYKAWLVQNADPEELGATY